MKFSTILDPSTLLTNVYYKFVAIDEAVIIARTNVGVTGSNGAFSVDLPSWDFTKIGTFTWDDSGSQSTIQQTGITSLSTIEDANQYFAGRLYSASWFQTAIYTQQQALNTAAGIIERFAYKGWPTTPGTSWPRTGIRFDGLCLDGTTTPESILEAQYEIAYALAQGADPEKDMRNVAVVSRGYSSVRVAYNPSLVQDYLKWGVPSGVAWNLMLPFLDLEADLAVKLHRLA